MTFINCDPTMGAGRGGGDNVPALASFLYIPINAINADGRTVQCSSL